MILKIIELFRNLFLDILSGVVGGINELLQTIIKSIIIVKEEAAYSSPIELIIVFAFFIGAGWFLFKFLIGSAQTFIKFVAVLSILSVITLIIILYR